MEGRFSKYWSFQLISWDTLPKEEEYALEVYEDSESVLKDFPNRHIVAPNPKV